MRLPLPGGTKMHEMQESPPIIMVSKRTHLRPHLSMAYQPRKYDGISTAELNTKENDIHITYLLKKDEKRIARNNCQSLSD